MLSSKPSKKLSSTCSSFSTWLTRVAINEALMLLRSRRAMREVPIDDSGSDVGTAPALEIPDASPDPEAKYLQREEVRILSAAMGEPGMRTAIELQELGELRKILRRFEITPKDVQRLTLANVANRTCPSLR